MSTISSPVFPFSNDNTNLIKGLLDKGLPFVSSYLERIIHRPIIITDNIGRISSPLPTKPEISVDNLFVDIPPEITEGEPYYNKENECLYYQIGQKETRAYVVVKNLPNDMLAETVSIIEDIKILIQIYFYHRYKIYDGQRRFERDLSEYLFLKSNAHIRDIFELYNLNLQMDKPYVIRISQIDETEHPIDMELLRSYTIDYCQNVNSVSISLCWKKYLVLIIPIQYNENTLEVDTEWPRIESTRKWKEVVDSKFKIVTSSGVGQIHTLQELYKSYQEALIALTLPKILGEKGSVEKFSDLGVYSLIFSQDRQNLKNYCFKTLGKIIEYDNEKNSNLLYTLRVLFDNDVNWKSAAENLFVHKNTLHYRIKEVEKLLNIDFSKMNTRINLFIAIKVMDLLKEIKD